ncbi:2-methylcitrate dehydratase [Sulfitobacter sp. JL08]|uniref:MmgE/PrpD family protein n=1 Tax=Sulfitobacter sp. JL08 TaxID=2070369 RepID=UPI000E0B11FC|nr:MmgE/PrpD family protein [Sulfitobacter sp. JL08]AXI54729.1 2-methylcitrate dehydratase [Sulfitobacter sp. JL08]
MADPVEQIVSAATAPPPPDALEVMRLSLVDWLSVGLAGREEPVSTLTRDMVLAEGGHAQATLFGGQKAPARAAALCNGACSHALDYDDTHFAHIGHPSVAVIPAALAVAEMCNATPEQMVRAALAGCEASVRFGLLFGRSHYQTGFHQTATAGAFGATVAAVLLLSDERAVMAHALGLVSTRASGLKSQFGTMGKPFNAGIAASNGVEAALLAQCGFISNPDAITGALGFTDTHHCEATDAQPDGFLMPQVQHKFHACCHGLHAALEALETLKPVAPDTVRTLRVHTNPRWMSVCNKSSVTTGLEAKFSYRAVLALSLAGHSTAALDSYNDTLCADPQLAALRARVDVVADDSIAETATGLVLDTDQGQRTATFDLNTPLTGPERAQRIRSKSAALLGADKADAVWQVVHAADATMADLTATMVP